MFSSSELFPIDEVQKVQICLDHYIVLHFLSMRIVTWEAISASISRPSGTHTTFLLEAVTLLGSARRVGVLTLLLFSAPMFIKSIRVISKLVA